MATFSAPAAKEHVKGLRAQIVHRADQEFPFLHDTMIVPLGGRLLMAWYNCSENEVGGSRPDVVGAGDHLRGGSP